ncbi:hypothetical protein BJX68DRAFT_264796 [Aspergillus pseudodeflectus]|uniref:Uncharacterized protein n=1 Tax=Aspergillus pseudodeflectus TaxID=176178 RepID=A0ABR4KP47_9EURO
MAKRKVSSAALASQNAKRQWLASHGQTSQGALTLPPPPPPPPPLPLGPSPPYPISAGLAPDPKTLSLVLLTKEI